VAPTDIGCSLTGFLFLQDLDDLFFSKSLLHALPITVGLYMKVEEF
jgi:hypothetical protein